METPSDEDDYWKQCIPCGYRFQPNDEELIIDYLLEKMRGGKIHPGLIRDIDLYKYEPSILQGLAFDHGDGKMYFFTPLRKKFEKGWKASRDTALGFWKASQKCTIIVNKTIIGSKTSLVYYFVNDQKPIKTQWLMYEYKLSKVIKPPDLEEVQEPMMLEKWVLCVVYYHKRSTKSGANDSNGNAHGSLPINMAGSSQVGFSCPDSCPNPTSNPNTTSTSCLNTDPTAHISNCNADQCQNSIPFRATSDYEQGLMYLAPTQNLYSSLNPIPHGSNILNSAPFSFTTDFGFGTIQNTGDWSIPSPYLMYDDVPDLAYADVPDLDSISSVNPDNNHYPNHNIDPSISFDFEIDTEPSMNPTTDPTMNPTTDPTILL